jgi:hypothetical protein
MRSDLCEHCHSHSHRRILVSLTTRLMTLRSQIWPWLIVAYKVIASDF